ncbi:MAG: TonB-dependent receptor [Acidobacteria bacterium]|nr:TonB-dependent receptor [Acidobacteriota bacterium]
MTRRIGLSHALVIAFALVMTRSAEARQPLSELTLEELMRIDAGRVFGASERIQPVTEAPASVSFITAEEIARYGYRTLADILRGVRGMYVTNDRNFSLLGTRGFGKPGDYNSRILLLINGHRVNDNVFGQAEIGAEFGLDPAMFERVEVIRGPASSLYGDSAFFAVVNVITKTGASLGGGSVAFDVGTLGTQLTRASLGHRFSNGVDAALSGTFERNDGVDRLYFPAFDTPETNNGIAEGLDGERAGQYYGRIAYKNLTVTGTYGSRRRDVPTASFGTLFNEQEFKEQTTDRHTLLDAEYVKPFAGARLSLRASYDRFTYDGTYPFVGENSDSPPIVGQDHVTGTRWTAGSRVTRPLPGRQTLTLGAEFIDNLEQDHSFQYLNPASTVFVIDRSSTQHALYAQNEVKLSRWLIVNAGLRYDGYRGFQDFSRVTPRTALIVMPSSHQSFKYLYGGAFRAPNTYELNPFYFGDRVQGLLPEAIDTHELVWERYSSDWLRTSVSTYWYKADRLITLTPDPSAPIGATYINEGQVRAAGLELEAQMRLRWRLESLVSYALQRATDQESEESLTNSPRHIAKMRLSVPGRTIRSSAAIELMYLGRRSTLGGTLLGAATTANLSVVEPIGRSFEIFGNIHNLFNVEYADPASDQHRQDSIPQNGRTFRAGLRWNFLTR